MALNPFFLQGSPNEQYLVQDLINEQIRMYGIEIYYLPRKIFKNDNIIKESMASKFDDSFALEAYVANYDGYNPGYDVMSKFGLTLKNELSLVISKERFEEFISPFLESMRSGIESGFHSDENISLEIVNRPKEGDLIYFPLGERLFELKRVELERPFYQLGSNYTYELNCELYEFENELIDTSIEEVDKTIKNDGYITTLKLVGVAKTAIASAFLTSGYIKEIFLNDDGKGYKTSPTVTITPAPSGGKNATAIAITKSVGGVRSVDRILLTNSGLGYTMTPKITISGGGGLGAAATCSISNVGEIGISSIVIVDGGYGYTSPPIVQISSPSPGIGKTAILESFINSDYKISSIRIVDSGSGYLSQPVVGFSSFPSAGIGTFVYNESVIGNSSGTVAVVRNFTKKTPSDISQSPIVELKVSINTGKFLPGEIIVGTISSARYIVESYDTYSDDTTYEQNKQIEIEADSIIDFSETNPFGDY